MSVPKLVAPTSSQSRRRCERRLVLLLASLAFAALACLGQCKFSLQDDTFAGEEIAPALVPQQLQDLDKALQTNEDDWKAFEQSGLYVEPYDPNVHTIPAAQVEYQRLQTAKDSVLYREILMDAIANKDKFAAGTRLIMRWGFKLLSNFLDGQRGEMQLPERQIARPDFFDMLANLTSEVIDLSTKLKAERGYDKLTVQIEDFRKRVDELFDHYKRIIDTSPVGGYLMWNNARFFKDQPQHPRHNVEMKQEAADLLAQFRGIGYESSTFFARRIVNMLNMFGKGITPKTSALI